MLSITLLSHDESPSLLTELLLQVVDAVYDCKSEVIGPGFFRFKAEIGKNLVFYYLSSLFNTKVKN